jgi:hypothetical protein
VDVTWLEKHSPGYFETGEYGHCGAGAGLALLERGRSCRLKSAALENKWELWKSLL